MKALAKMYRGQYRAIEDAVEAWKPDHDMAMAVRDLEEVIQNCLWVNERNHGLVNKAFKIGFSGKIRNSEGLGKALLKSLKAGVEAWQSIEEASKACMALNFVADGAEKIPTALAEVVSLAKDFEARWPFVREADVVRGATEIAVGDFVTGEELLRELQGQAGQLG